MTTATPLHSYQAIEEWLISTWKELLSTDDIGTHSDFFDLGADSLTVIRLLSRIQKTFGQNALEVDTLFVQSQLSQTANALYDSIQINN